MKKQDLISAINSVNISKEAENRILCKTLNYVHKKERNSMSKKKLCVIAAAATLTLGVVAYAASGIISSWCSSSSSVPKYKTFPTSQQITKDIGYAPKMIEKFNNDYTFESTSIVNNDLKDEANKSVEKFKSTNTIYKKENDKVYLSANKFSSEMKISGKVIDTADEIDLYYTSYTNKSVPADYKLTDEDKKAEKNGELIFSYGSSEVSISKVQGLTWKQDDIQYNLMQIDGTLSSDELSEMAKEIIAK